MRITLSSSSSSSFIIVDSGDKDFCATNMVTKMLLVKNIFGDGNLYMTYRLQTNYNVAQLSTTHNLEPITTALATTMWLNVRSN